MPLINQALPNLIGGVSQQPDVTRFEGQCEEQENALSSVVDGLSKRPQTQHIAELLNTAISANSFIHFIDRSQTERYVYIQDGQDIHLFNAITGARCIVGTPARDVYNNVQVGGVPLNKWNNSISVSDNFLTPLPIYYNATATQKTNGDLYDIEVFTPVPAFSYTRVRGFSRVSNTKYISKVNNVNENFGYFKLDGNNNLSVSGTWREADITQDGNTISNIGTDNFGTGEYPVDTSIVYEYNTTSKTDFLSSSSHYLRQGNDPKSNTRAISLGDTSLLLNTSVTVAHNNTAITSVSDDLVLFIKQGDYQKEYGFSFVKSNGDRTECYITSGDNNHAGNASTLTILDNLAKNNTEGIQSLRQTLLNAGFDGRGLSHEFSVNTNTFINTDATAFYNTVAHTKSNLIALKNNTYTGDIQPVDGLGSAGMGVVYKSVDAITDLPLFCLNGMVVKVKGDVESSADDYYVKFVADNIDEEGFTEFTGTYNGKYILANAGHGSWEETVGDVSSSGLDNTTMPYSLVNNNVNQFLLMPTLFETIQAGDLESNAHPSFVDNKINNLFFYKDRLGFLSNDKVIMSEAGLGTLNPQGFMSYNFYRNTVSTSLDSDRIDITVASSDVTTLQHAVGFQENLILFATGGQFVLRSSDLLTAQSVSITPITNFETDITVKPTVVGSYIYFPFNRGSYEGIREFTVNSTTDNYDAHEITEHVPAYVPNDLNTLVGNSSEDIIIGFAPSTPKTLYIYKYFWSGTKKLLSSWSKFTFPFDIRGVDIMEGTAYIAAVKQSKTHLMEMPLQSGVKDLGVNYTTYLDMRKKQTLSNSNSVQLGFTASVGDRVQVYDDEGNILHNQVLSAPTSSVTMSSSHTGSVFSGLAYTMKYTFSEQVFKAAAGNSSAPSAFVRAQIRNGVVFFNDTDGFTISVTPDKRAASNYTYSNPDTSFSVGADQIGNLNLQSNSFKFPVFTDAFNTVITIENESALPANFSSAEFEMFVHERSRRFG